MRYNLLVQVDGLDSDRAGILDLSLDLSMFSGLAVRAGQYKFDFDIEARAAEAETRFSDRSFASNAVAGGLDGTSSASRTAAGSRDRGASLLGRASRGGASWSFAAGLFEGGGLGGDRNERWNSVWNLRVERGALKLNGGWLKVPQQGPTARPQDDFTAWTAALELTRRRWFFRTEHYGAERELPSGRQALYGFYLLGSYVLRPDLDLLLRYQRLRDEQFEPGSDTLRSTDLGARWFVGGRSGALVTSVALN